MPPYVALAIVSMQRALNTTFQLLTPQTVPELIGSDFLKKSWGFTTLDFSIASNIESIIAKSDYIRMAYVYRYGGAWLDADTLLINNPTAKVFPNGITSKLHWHSEALFGSLAGNPLLGEAVTTSLKQNVHCWGNPGEIKDVVRRHHDEVTLIPNSILDPGYRPLYNFSTCDIMLRHDISVSEFITNNTDILKLYNTYFTRKTRKQLSVADFLKDGTLLAKLFLHIDPDPQYWISQSEILIEQCQPKI